MFDPNDKDLQIQTFPRFGRVNEAPTGVRITHKPSGAVGQSTQEKGLLKNKQVAYERLIKSVIYTEWRDFTWF